MAQWVKNLPVMQETQEMQVQSLGWEDSLKEEMAMPSSLLVWKILCPMNKGAWQATVYGVTKESDTT